MTRDGQTPPSPCLTDELLTELIDGRLGSEELSSLHAHAAGCASCLMLLGAVGRGGTSPADSGTSTHSRSDEMLADRDVSPASRASWSPPTEFDEFRLVRELGRGAMGVVYLADDLWLERQVAVKFIAAPRPDARVRARFLNEARAIARLQHPNVVTLFRVGEVGGHPYLVSEYLQGQNLSALPRPLPWRRVLRLGLGLVRGLTAAHRQGVLHRDIKPSNVFLTSAGEVKLLDFGLAELVEAGASLGPRASRSFVGTPRYMAPELFRGESSTPRSDLYALGLVLYELCTGTLPRRAHGRSTPFEPDELPPLLERVPGMDPELASLIDRCLRVASAERFASAETLCEALERIEQPHAPASLAAGNPYRGLEAFEAEHRALFFGRDADIRVVLERLRRQPLVLVTGDSGVGKSSLCRAGVLPLVVQGALDESRDYSILTLWPGRHPLAALAAALAPLLGRVEAELIALLQESPSRLGALLRAAHAEGRGLLLFVDQLEELLTLSEPSEAARFASFLGELALPAPGVRVLLTVRGDFLTRLGALPGLGGEVERALFLLRPLSPEGLREAIVGPARARGVVFESEALIRTLVESMAQGAGGLPLLQFALAELWERRDAAEGRITRAALEDMGGVAGALSRHADSVLARLGHSERQAATRMLLRLVTAEGTRGALSEEELTEASPEARAALHALVEGRLLHARIAGDGARHEIAHEALIESWSTLRHLLEKNVGQRALQQRLEAASAEWERMGRAEDALWSKRQLEETRVLEAGVLGPRQQAFLDASWRAVHRRRWLGWGAALLLGLVVAAAYGGPRLLEYRKTQRFVSERLRAAREARARGEGLGQEAGTRREEALALFDGHVPAGFEPPPPLEKRREEAERVWATALETLEQADAAHARTERALEEALERAPGHAEARGLLAELTYERILLAESFHRDRERERLAQRFERLAAGGSVLRARLETPAGIELLTEPPGARVELWRYVDERGVRRRVPVPEVALGTTPVAGLRLPAGSYHLRFTREGHAPVDLPLLLERGGQERVHLVLPTAVPEGFAYVPPGCSLLGSAEPEDVREFMRSAPLHRVCLKEGYLIGRTEVTIGDWLDYLNGLPERAPARRLLEEARFGGPGALLLKRLPGAGWRFSLLRTGGGELTAGEGEPLHYPGRTRRAHVDWRRLPLTGVSVEDLGGYFAWLDETGLLPGARLCTEHEWERAARGADGRRHPHGDRLLPDDANIDVTYGRKVESFGPDEVGAHPASVSPFGLQDMAGNAFEMTRPVTPDMGSIVLRGGAWYYERISTFAANRVAGASTLREVTVGTRLCAPAPAR